MVVGSDGSNAVTVVRRLVSGSSRLVPDFVSFTPGRTVDRVRRDGCRPEARTGHRRPERHASGLRRVVCRLRALRVRAPASRRRADPRRQPLRSLVAPARPATGRLRGRASPLVAERPQHHLRHEPPEQRPRALRDPVGRQRAARADRRLDRRARPGVVARREHAGVHLGPLRRPRVQGLRPHAAHRPRRRDLRRRALTRHGSGVYDSGAAWSPDGSKIAFVRATSDTPSRLYTVNPDGSGPRTPRIGHARGGTGLVAGRHDAGVRLVCAELGRHHRGRRGRRRRPHRGTDAGGRARLRPAQSRVVARRQHDRVHGPARGVRGHRWEARRGGS